MRVINMATTVSNLTANCLSFKSFGSSLASRKEISPSVMPLGFVAGSLVWGFPMVSLIVSAVIFWRGTWCDDITPRVLLLVAIATAKHIQNILCSLSGRANLFSTRHVTCVSTDPTANPVLKRARFVKILLRVVTVVVAEVAPQYGAAAADSDDHGDNDNGGRGDSVGCGDGNCGWSGNNGGDANVESDVS